MVSKTVKKWAKHFKSKGVLRVLSPQSTDLTKQSTLRERQLWVQLAASSAWVDPIEVGLALELRDGSVLEGVQTRLRLQELVLNAV